MKEFAGKTAVITGGANEVGYAMAEWCVRHGVRVMLADLDDAALMHARQSLKAMGGTVLTMSMDHSRRDAGEISVDREEVPVDAGQLPLKNGQGACAGVPWEAMCNEWEWWWG